MGPVTLTIVTPRTNVEAVCAEQGKSPSAVLSEGVIPNAGVIFAGIASTDPGCQWIQLQSPEDVAHLPLAWEGYEDVTWATRDLVALRF